MRAALCVFCALATGAGAQGIETLPLEEPATGLVEDGFIEATPIPSALEGVSAALRSLDKVSGEVFEFELAAGGTQRIGRLEVRMAQCRYPEENPEGDAFAWIEVMDVTRQSTLYQGWMVASSPALNPFDHPRYDVWVLRCKTA